MTSTRRLTTAALALFLIAPVGGARDRRASQRGAARRGHDTTSMYAGNGREVDVLANDTDADGPDDLHGLPDRRVDLQEGVRREPGRLGVVFAYSLPGAKPGTYTFTYYACDYQALVPGTLTVTIDPEPEVTAKAIAGQPRQARGHQPGGLQDQVPLRVLQAARARRHRQDREEELGHPERAPHRDRLGRLHAQGRVHHAGEDQEHRACRGAPLPPPRAGPCRRGSPSFWSSAV